MLNNLISPVSSMVTTIVSSIVFAIVYLYYKLTQIKPIIIHNLDTESFLMGCNLANSRNHTKVDISKLNPHALLGYKITILMSTHHFLKYSSKTTNYVEVIIGDDTTCESHVIYKYTQTKPDINHISELINVSCCAVIIRNIEPPKDISFVINILNPNIKV